MNIRWNADERRFEAEFSSDFNGDLSALKTVGFGTDGPPTWVWHTHKIAVLNKLRENRPASGLTITPEALEIYKPLALQEEKNSAVRKELAKAKKEAKKERKQNEQEAVGQVTFAGLTEEKWWLDASDLSPLPPFKPTYTIPPAPAGPLCVVCNQIVYFYEKQDPPTCLWCEKIRPAIFDSAYIKNRGII